ncbi:hypothetical protein HOD29_05360 [archaeon]|jgi:hypothetical protein|nr:hypothetical protein [archaeon]
MRVKEDLSRKEIISKIMEKKEFSKIMKKDVELVFDKFDKQDLVLEDKIKKTRDLLRKMYSVFVSDKLFNKKDESPEWFLKKHVSTRERFDYYPELYGKLLKEKDVVFDLGAGINGFSFSYFPKGVEYIGVESVGQLVDLMNYYFKTRGLNGGAIHESLFDLDKIKKYLKQVKGTKVVFLFKVIDSLEMLKRNYSKEFLLEIVPLVDRVVVSFATKSLVSRKSFKATRNWLYYFIKENFNLLDDFEIGAERYLVFSKR